MGWVEGQHDVAIKADILEDLVVELNPGDS